MNIGIIKAKDKQYYISKTNNTYKVECITDEKAYTLTKEETIDLIKNVFSSDMKKISEENNLTIYEDAAKNKRFFENGEENYLYFFYYNGTDALLYQGKIFDKIKELEKEFKINSKVYGLMTMYATIELLMFISLLLGKVDIQEFPKEDYYFLSTTQITADDLENDINFALKDTLSNEKIDYLCDKDLLEDVLKVANPAHKYILSKYIHSLDLTYFSEEEREKKYDINGLYSTLNNKISLKDNSDDIFYSSAAHEMVHALQDNNSYYYIKEACAEIIAYEYYGSEKTSYQEPRHHVAALMELIGPQPIFECNFKGDTTSFEDAIRAHLSKEDAEELLELFSHSPHYNLSFEKESAKIEELILKMYKNIYHKDGQEDKPFLSILNGSTDNRYYFNTHSEHYNKEFVFPYQKEKYDEIGEDNINCYVREIIYNLSEEEYNILKENPENKVWITYIPNEGYYFENTSDGETRITDGINSYSTSEAIEKGLVSIYQRLLSKKSFYYTLQEYAEVRDVYPADFDESVVRFRDTIIRKDNYEEYIITDIEGNTIFCKTIEELYETLPPMNEKFPDQMNFETEAEKVY